jgi:hypothetical protein
MSSTSMPARRVAIGRFRLLAAVGSTRAWSRFATLLATGLALTAARPAAAGPELTIGNVNTFATSSSGTNPTGTWTLGDKDYSYLSSSTTTGTTGWLGFERIKILENVNPSLYSHQFLMENLSGYNSPKELFLGYHIRINGSQGPLTFQDVSMSQIFSGNTVEVWKDVFGSLSAFNAATGPGAGNLAAFYSLNGSVTPTISMPPNLTELWVRDTFKLSSPGGSVSSINNTFRQTVPEIDPQSFASVLAIVTGALGILERRARRWLGLALPV